MLQTTRYPVKDPMLKKLIKYYWVIESQSPIEINHKLLPVSNVDFILNLSSPIKYLIDEKTEIVPTGFHFNGIRDKHYFISQTGRLRVIGISFFSTGLFPIFKMPISEFKNKTIDLDLAISNFTESIMNKINESQSIPKVISIIENELIQKVDMSFIPKKEILKIVDVFSENINDFNIKSLCNEYGINQRRLERIFNKYIGISPKLFYRISRFQQIINQIERISEENFTAIAYNNNYYDQTHFIKDFKLFTGSTPVDFFSHSKSVKQIIKYC